MSVEVGIWRIDHGLEQLQPSHLDAESRLEDVLEKDIAIIGLDLLIVGRQVKTDYGKWIDLLAIDSEGALYVIELKRDKTPRDAVAQLLDYGSWVKNLTYSDVTTIYSTYCTTARFEEAFASRFGTAPPEAVNEEHHLVLVASQLDPSSERIVGYCSLYGVPINAVFFHYYQDDGREYIARTWLIDPVVAEAMTSKGQSAKPGSEPWNGQDFYVSIGEGIHRTWEDCRRYGFVSGGQGRWYSRTLEQLIPGARVFACVPGKGYVGAGRVTGASQPVKTFTVEVDGKESPILEVPVQAPNMGENADDPERSEYLVRVEWIKTVPVANAIWEAGMFANQNTVCKLRNKFTIERLVDHFGLAES